IFVKLAGNNVVLKSQVDFCTISLTFGKYKFSKEEPNVLNKSNSITPNNEVNEVQKRVLNIRLTFSLILNSNPSKLLITETIINIRSKKIQNMKTLCLYILI